MAFIFYKTTMNLYFSVIIPVYNRPEEVRELLDSLVDMNYSHPYEIIIIEDGSDLRCEEVVTMFTEHLPVRYLFKNNSGPGASRNYGMRHANGNYFIILDSDCLVPPSYLEIVRESLATGFVDAFGGPDSAHASFSVMQKAINFAMTSLWTTGGIRGSRFAGKKFQPRSFNMGISWEAFEATGGFGQIHPGEDPDLSIRLWKLGYKTKLIANATVYHKRRINLVTFYRQVMKFGKVRPILIRWHPGTASITYWVPMLFWIGMILAVLLAISGLCWPLYIFLAYLLFLFMAAAVTTRDLRVAAMAIPAVLVQFAGYGLGFLISVILINFGRREPQEAFPELFFKEVHSE